jgi:hypothetical protein
MDWLYLPHGRNAALRGIAGSSGAPMDKKSGEGSQDGQKAQGVWERRTQDRRWGQNQLFGSVRIDSGSPGMSHSDPTDSALAAIASILEKPARPIGRPATPPPLPVVEEPAAAPAEPVATTSAAENFRFSDADAVAAGPLTPTPPTPPAPQPPTPTDPVPATPPAPPPELDGYVKLGPGPLEAIRFKWSTRDAGNGTYFVDETIGTTSRPMTSGPMSKEAAIQFIDAREADAWRRFNALKNEMTSVALSLVQPPPLPGAGEK